MNEPFKLGLMKKVSSLRTKEDFSAFIVYNLLELREETMQEKVSRRYLKYYILFLNSLLACHTCSKLFFHYGSDIHSLGFHLLPLKP